MQRYIVIRLLQSLLALWVMSLIVFSLARITGNPMDAMLPMEADAEEYARMEKHWGLDKPLHVQYLTFLGNAMRGDFGKSWKWQGYSAMGLVLERLPATLELAGVALAISVLLALPIGVLSAVMKDTPIDSLAKSLRCSASRSRRSGWESS
jgi:peptide/nickel transport system permease protein